MSRLSKEGAEASKSGSFKDERAWGQKCFEDLNQTFLRDTNAGLRSISQAASMGVQGDLMSNERWGRECMLQLQEDENWNKPTATTWAAEFLLRGGRRQRNPGRVDQVRQRT